MSHPEDVDDAKQRFHRHLEDHWHRQQKNGSSNWAFGKVLLRTHNCFTKDTTPSPGPAPGVHRLRYRRSLYFRRASYLFHATASRTVCCESVSETWRAMRIGRSRFARSASHCPRRRHTLGLSAALGRG